MKFLCDECSRLLEIKEFQLREGALVLVCPACRHEGRVAPAGVPDRKPAPVLELAKPRPPPTGPLCPKCGAPHPEAAEACARCGLVFALFKPENLALPEPLEELWREAEAHWSEPERHAAFLAACGSADVLSEAVRRYRLRAEQDPGDAVASRMRDDATARLLATAELALPARPGGGLKQAQATSPLLLAVAVLCAAAIAGAVFYFMRPLLMPP